MESNDDLLLMMMAKMKTKKLDCLDKNKSRREIAGKKEKKYLAAVDSYREMRSDAVFITKKERKRSSREKRNKWSSDNIVIVVGVSVLQEERERKRV